MQEIPSDRPDNSIIRPIGFSAPCPSEVNYFVLRGATEDALHPVVYNEWFNVMAYTRTNVVCTLQLMHSLHIAIFRIVSKIDTDSSEFIKVNWGYRSCRWLEWYSRHPIIVPFYIRSINVSFYRSHEIISLFTEILQIIF